jgi:hypothetical protein
MNVYPMPVDDPSSTQQDEDYGDIKPKSRDLSSIPPIPSSGLSTATIRPMSAQESMGPAPEEASPTEDQSDLAIASQEAAQPGIPAPNVRGLKGTVDANGVVSFIDAQGRPTGIKHFPDGHSEMSTPSGRYTMLPGSTKFVKANPVLKQDPDTKEWIDFTDPEHPKRVPVPDSGIDIPRGVTGEDAIKNLSPRDQEYVRDYATFKMPSPVAGRPNPTLNRLLPYVTAYNPNWSAPNYQAQQQTVKQFASNATGSPGYNVTSINTAIDHLGSLWERAQALDNKSWRKYNTLGNYINNEFGKPEVAAFNDERTRVATELARAFTGGVPSDQQIKEAEASLNNANSSAQLKAVIQGTIPEMLNARLGELNYAYERTMGKPYGTDIVSPGAQKVLSSFGITDFGHMKSVSPGDAQPVPQSGPLSQPAQPVSKFTPEQHVATASFAQSVLNDPKSSPAAQEAARRALAVSPLKQNQPSQVDAGQQPSSP